MGRKLIYLDDAIDEIEMLLEQSEDDEHDKTWNNAIRGSINAVKHHVPSAQTDLSGYSDRLWKRAYDRGYERCRQDAIDALEEQLDYLDMLNKDENPTARSKWYGVNWARNTIADLPSAQPSNEYEKGWKDGQEALREEMWEYGRDRLD